MEGPLLGVKVLDLTRLLPGDYCTLMAAIGILMGVIARQKSGKGQFVDISMLDGIVSWLSMIGSQFLADGKEPGREEMMLNGKYLCYRVYETKDHRYLTVGALEPKF